MEVASLHEEVRWFSQQKLRTSDEVARKGVLVGKDGGHRPVDVARHLAHSEVEQR